MATGRGHEGDEMVGSFESGQSERSTSGKDQERELPPPPTQPQDGGSNAQEHRGKKRKRHTAQQIQQMEALFNECSHPDHQQQMKLSEELGLNPRQVKFWFQNRRSNMKAQRSRDDSTTLREENESLQLENQRLQAARRNVACLRCGNAAWLLDAFPEVQRLRFENARLKEDMERLSRITDMYGISNARFLDGQPPAMQSGLDAIHARATFPPIPGPSMAAMPDPGTQMSVPGKTVLTDQEDQVMALDLAMTAADQLLRMCRTDEPLWVRGNAGVGDPKLEVLNLDEYAKAFHWPVDLDLLLLQQHPGIGELRMEASRDRAIIAMNSIDLLDAFLDANKWAELFPSLVLHATTIQFIIDGRSANGHCALHLMYAELRFPSPVVALRRAYFFRYCQRNAEEGTWTVVDFPVDGLHSSVQVAFRRYRRRLSGCLIEDMPNGYSKVTWVEVAQVEDNLMHQLFDEFVRSGMAFGARRWLVDLQLQSERFASLMATNLPNLGVISTLEEKRNMMRLSQRLMRTFLDNISASVVPTSWMTMLDSGREVVSITTRRSTEVGQPIGVVLCAVSTVWLPYSHEQVFELLVDGQRRFQMDVILQRNSRQEIMHMVTGSDERNCISLMSIDAPSSSSSQNMELMLQESSIHPSSGGLIVYATMDAGSFQQAMSVDVNQYSCIPLLPTGIVIVPAVGPPSAIGWNASIVAKDNNRAQNPTGCLLTMGLQTLASPEPSSEPSVSSISAINSQLCSTINGIAYILSLS